MGVNIHVYSYWGVRTEWNKAISEAYEELYEQDIEPDEDVSILMDGMSCEYMVFGVRLYDSGDSRWGEMVNANELEINDEILGRMKSKYMENFQKLYPSQYDWLAEKPWKLVNLVNYS